MAVKLKSDKKTFDGETMEVTTPHYFEAPVMRKWNDLYYLMFSTEKLQMPVIVLAMLLVKHPWAFY